LTQSIYVSFSDQKTEFTARQQELDKGREAIQELITSLDQRKDEAIERTFRGVAKHFSSIFQELRPNGSASLRISRDEDESGSQSRVMRYNGISIRVSFEGKEENQIMQQLSGGQKSLVALCLIFAIQRADPAPFYLFDEVDAALDPDARQAVALMIQKQSENTQFIISTFHSPFVEIANQWYGIKFKHGVSRLVSIKKEDALRIMQEGDGKDKDAEVPQGKKDEDEEMED